MMGEQEGVRWALRTIHKKANSSAVSLVGHRDCRSQPGDERVVSSSLTLQATLLVPLSGSCSGPLWFYRGGKRLPVKADLAIYSLIVGMSGPWENVATINVS